MSRGGGAAVFRRKRMLQQEKELEAAADGGLQRQYMPNQVAKRFENQYFEPGKENQMNRM